MIPQNKQSFKNAENEVLTELPEIRLFRDLLELAIKDLHAPDPIRRRRARWWIFKDQSEGLDIGRGYISFHTTCEILGIEPMRARGILNEPAARRSKNTATDFDGSRSALSNQIDADLRREAKR